MIERLGLHRPHRAIIVTIIACVALVDISGTPLAIFSLRRAEGNFNRSTQQVIAARHDDCVEANFLRARGRKRVEKERRELLKTLALLHIADTPEIAKKASDKFALELRELAARDCFAYAHRAG